MNATNPPIFLVDSFTSEAFGGNPAAVCLLDGARDPAWMQAVAAEMNLSETAFVHPAGGRFALRWFTPTVEVDLCGHATLATAHVLWSGRPASGDEVARFETLSGTLTATRRGDWIELDLPARPVAPAAAPDGLLEALGVEAEAIAASPFDHLIELTSERAVRAATPDFRRLGKVTELGVIITARSDDPAYDFVSRFFAPGLGIDEDPVTGAAHCSLAPYWSAKLGKEALTGFQASKRGGVVRVRPAGDRVFLEGQAVTITQGEIMR
jgi:PhzF family phenazine biosynthesis protein